MPFFLFLFCIACERYETPKLPAFSDDTVSYEQLIEKKKLLEERVKRNTQP